jgi:DnaJ like chaperone protein
MFERMDPKTLMKWLILAAVVYFVLPFDLIPDYIGIPGSERSSPAQPKQAKAFGAYEVLGIGRSASSDAIVTAYRDRMKEYHPDKVAHLGEALQQLAHKKSQEIQRAYKQLRS